MTETYMSIDDFIKSLGPSGPSDDLEWHSTEDYKVDSEGTARVFGYSNHTPGKAIRNIQYISAVGLDCEFCFGDVRPAAGYFRCQCCDRNVWACAECAESFCAEA